eukprot:976252-Prorocentrum_minimum.AAC.3
MAEAKVEGAADWEARGAGLRIRRHSCVLAVLTGRSRAYQSRFETVHIRRGLHRPRRNPAGCSIAPGVLRGYVGALFSSACGKAACSARSR